MKDEDIKLPEIDEAVFQFMGQENPPKIWDHIEKWSVSKAGLQASTLANNIDLAIAEAMQEYARQSVRMNLEEDKSIIQQARAWELVHGALSMVRPGWYECGGTGQDAAVKTILDLGAKAAVAQPKPSDPEPFDLARAMAGEPIVTRDGRKAEFVAYDKGANPAYRVLARIGNGSGAIGFCEDGRLSHAKTNTTDLFMAPKPKQTVWVNVWSVSDGVMPCRAHETKEAAIAAAKDNGEYLAIAHPIEIDATE